MANLNSSISPEQALGNIKSLLDAGIQKGIFTKAEDVLLMVESFNTISTLVDQAKEAAGRAVVGNGEKTATSVAMP